MHLIYFIFVWDALIQLSSENTLPEYQSQSKVRGIFQELNFFKVNKVKSAFSCIIFDKDIYFAQNCGYLYYKSPIGGRGYALL